MSKIKFTAVVAMDEYRGIGYKGKNPWGRRLGELKIFRERTIGHPVLMGRKTWESLSSRPLKGRQNIVLTRQKGYEAEGAYVINSIDELEKLILIHNEVMVIGGESVYKELMPMFNKLIVTRFDGIYNSDAVFPEYESDFFVQYTNHRSGVAQDIYKRMKK